jgi:hypothetical protein
MVNIKFTNKLAGFLPYLPVFSLGIAMEILFLGGRCREKKIEMEA